MVDVDEPIRTWRPAELHAALNDVIEHVFGSVVWVEGEVSDLTRSRAGHVYFRLVDADGEGSRPHHPPPAQAVQS